MKSSTYYCDVCKRPRQEVNHWFRVKVGKALHIYRWNEKLQGCLDRGPDIRHICGQECLLKIVQTFADSTASRPTGVVLTLTANDRNLNVNSDPHDTQ